MSETSAFKLIIEDDEGRRSIIPVDLGRVSIGRLESNAIRLDERNVSREHARLVRDNDSVFAEDLDSYNGVWVNGDRIQGRHEIREGDVIRIGDFQLELRGEGLQRRTEETTQRTMLSASEATNPGIRLAAEGAPAPAPPSAPAPVPARDAPRPAAPPVEAGPDHEATAIIRLDAPELRAPRGQTGALAGQRARLVCVSTQLAGREFEITKSEVVLGRTGENDIAIDHRSVSRHHAKITVVKGRYVLHDLQSANGTLVNGEAYAQTELQRGDLVELGHVKLRFVPPGETYAPSPGEPAASRAPVPVGDEDTVVPAMVRRIPPRMLAGGAMAVLLLVIVVALLASSNDERPAAPGAMVVPTAGAAETDALLGRAQVALAQRRWDQAATLAAEVLAVDPSSAVARDLVTRAQTEQQAQAVYEQATRAVEAADWGGAWGALQRLPRASVYAEQSRALLERVKGALVADLAAKARAALEAQDFDAAVARADEIASIDPTRSEPAQLQAEIEQRRVAATIATPARRPSSPAPAKTPPRPAVAPQRAPRGAPTASAPAPVGLATEGGDAKALYAEAVGLLRAGDVDAAVDKLMRCIQIDPGYALCYRALGISHARLGNVPKAAKYYKQYLKVAPDSPDADRVRQLLESYETAPP